MKTMPITIHVPTIINDFGLQQDYFQEAIAAMLFHNGILTSHEARKLIGKSRREFEEMVLPKFGYTPMDNFPDNIEIEIEASKR